jgi:hypothetical protein
MFTKNVENYLKKGLSCFPVMSTKKPAIPTWAQFQERMPSKAEIAEWKRDLGEMNIAIVTGKRANLTVIDCDTPEAIEAIEKLLPDTYELPIAKTPRGQHYYFEYCKTLKNKSKTQPGIDIRNDGGYIIAPPGRSKNGGRYEWHESYSLHNTQPPPVPKEIVSYLKTPDTYTPPKNALLKKGSRNEDLFHAALVFFKDRRSRGDVERIILNMARAAEPPLPDKEAVAAVNSAEQRVLKNGNEKARLDLEGLEKIEMRPVRWLWYPIAPFGAVGTLLGNPGVAKTFVLADLTARISSGKPLPIYRKPSPPMQGKVIYVTSEGIPDKILKPRLYAAGAVMENIKLIRGVLDEKNNFLTLDVRQHLPLIKELVLEEKGKESEYVLIVIDPIASFVSGKTNLNDSTQARQALDVVARFSEETETAVLVAIHPNKDETKTTIARAAGSMQMSAAVKTAWVVTEPEKKDPHNKRYLAPYKIQTEEYDKNETLPFFLETAKYVHQGENFEVGKVRWGDELEKCNIEKIFSPRVDEGIPPAVKVRLFVKEQLWQGARKKQDIIDAGGDLGFSPYQIRRAADALGVNSAPTGFGEEWVWSLPEKVEK